jgi:glycosyltransferase involved in cell wall biosynthesis
MHLTTITPFPPSINGIGQYAELILQLICQSGEFRRLTVLTEKNDYIDPVNYDKGLEIQRSWHQNDILAGLRILTQIHRLKPDIIWHNVALTGFGRSPFVNLINLLLVSSISLTKIPYVITLHELAEQADLQGLGAPHSLVARKLARRLTSIITHADVICVTLRRHAKILATYQSGARIIHIPHGAYQYPQIIPENESRNLLFCGVIAPFKGIDTLMSAFQELLIINPLTYLTIVGAEHPRFPGYLNYLRNKYDNISNVRWTGYIRDDTELRNEFGKATIAVIPYTATTGTSGMLYRAITWGRPVVASNLPEIRSAVDEERLIVNYFEPGNAPDLAYVLSYILSNPLLRHEQIEHNYYRCIDHLTPQHTSISYIQAFRLAIEAH